jgi:hypothetical protein
MIATLRGQLHASSKSFCSIAPIPPDLGWPASLPTATGASHPSGLPFGASSGEPACRQCEIAVSNSEILERGGSRRFRGISERGFSRREGSRRLPGKWYYYTINAIPNRLRLHSELWWNWNRNLHFEIHSIMVIPHHRILNSSTIRRRFGEDSESLLRDVVNSKALLPDERRDGSTKGCAGGSNRGVSGSPSALAFSVFVILRYSWACKCTRAMSLCSKESKWGVIH